MQASQVENNKELSELCCDICGSNMYLTRTATAAFFDCSNPNCKQKWDFSKDSEGRTVVKYLWPKMDGNSKMFREQYLPAWITEQKFRIQARFISGIDSKEDRDKQLKEVHETLTKWYVEHPKRKWWQVFLRKKGHPEGCP